MKHDKIGKISPVLKKNESVSLVKIQRINQQRDNLGMNKSTNLSQTKERVILIKTVSLNSKNTLYSKDKLEFQPKKTMDLKLVEQDKLKRNYQGNGKIRNDKQLKIGLEKMSIFLNTQVLKVKSVFFLEIKKILNDESKIIRKKDLLLKLEKLENENLKKEFDFFWRCLFWNFQKPIEKFCKKIGKIENEKMKKFFMKAHFFVSTKSENCSQNVKLGDFEEISPDKNEKNLYLKSENDEKRTIVKLKPVLIEDIKRFRFLDREIVKFLEKEIVKITQIGIAK